MADDGKWDAATRALNALFDEYLSGKDEDTALGLLVFSDHKDATGADGPYPTAIDVPPAYVDQNQYNALRARIANTRPVGPTPTYTALDGAYQAVRAYVPMPPVKPRGRHVVVLLSDGSPNAITASGGHDSEKDRTVALVHQALTTPPSILTYAIGIGPFPPPAWFDYDPAFMGNVAVAGGTRASQSCEPGSLDVKDICHFQITPGPDRTTADLAADMLRALHDARARTVDPCTYTLEGDLAHLDPAKTTVTITSGGASHDVSHDASNGWEYDVPGAPHGIALHGAACDQVTNDASATVSLNVACG
jgi:hypothetical protein